MHREFITPRDRQHWLDLRAGDITSTDVAALFGLSPYKTAFELWHEHSTGERAAVEETERMRWGNRLEAAIAQCVAEEQDWSVRPFKDYGRLPEHRIGSSFDFAGMDGVVMSVMDIPPQHHEFILEIKNVDSLQYARGWIIEDDFVEAPPHIELQVQHQMLVSGLRVAYIAALIGGNRLELLRREADDAAHAAILQRVTEFWRSVESGQAPDPVYPQDAAAVIRMNSHAEPGKLLESTDPALLAELQAYADASAAAKRAEDDKQSAKARILAMIGDHETVLTPAGKISAGITAPVAPKIITADMVGQEIGGRAGFRGFLFTPKKTK